MTFNLIRELINNNYRVFSIAQAKELGLLVGITPKSMTERLARLEKKGMIDRIMKGLYTLSSEFLAGIPIHEYEIALAFVQPSAIAYLSAISFHHLTDQISSIIYVLCPSDGKEMKSYSTYKLRGIQYRIITIKREWFFGLEQRWLSEASITITDFEKTLIDALIKPKYCGGIREVLYAFEQAHDRLNIEKIISYALRINKSTCKRLGWVLSKLGTQNKDLEILRTKIHTSYTLLDSSLPRKGKVNKEWYVIENL